MLSVLSVLLCFEDMIGDMSDMCDHNESETLNRALCLQSFRAFAQEIFGKVLRLSPGGTALGHPI